MDGGEQKELPSLSVGDSNVSDAVTTVVIDEAISEMDDDGTVYTPFGFLVHWRDALRDIDASGSSEPSMERCPAFSVT